MSWVFTCIDAFSHRVRKCDDSVNCGLSVEDTNIVTEILLGISLYLSVAVLGDASLFMWCTEGKERWISLTSRTDKSCSTTIT